MNLLKKFIPQWIRYRVPYNLKQRLKKLFVNDKDSPLPTKIFEYQYLDHIIYEAIWESEFGKKTEAEIDYFRRHKNRYYELLNAMAYYLKQFENPSVLEIGVSEFLGFYKKIFPEIFLTTIDRPIENSGFDSGYCLFPGRSDRHYNLDLNKESLSKDFGSPPLGTFDYAICTEVIEHLSLNPITFLKGAFSILNDNGYLYLTTPNFFSYHNLQKIARRENPQSVVPAPGENWDAHYHFREYEMNELILFINQAGGIVIDYYYSHCWDDPVLIKNFLTSHPEQKSNLVIIAQKKISGNPQVSKEVDC